MFFGPGSSKQSEPRGAGEEPIPSSEQKRENFFFFLNSWLFPIESQQPESQSTISKESMTQGALKAYRDLIRDILKTEDNNNKKRFLSTTIITTEVVIAD